MGVEAGPRGAAAAAGEGRGTLRGRLWGVGPGEPWGDLQPEGARGAQHSQRQRGHVGALCQRLRLLEAGAGYSQHLRFQLLGESLPGAPAARSAGLAAAFCCLAPRSQFESLVNFAGAVCWAP